MKTLQEGEDAGATQVFFKDYLQGDGDFPYDSDNSNNYEHNFFNIHKIMLQSLCIQRKRIQKTTDKRLQKR